jgi:hypothetical protein
VAIILCLGCQKREAATVQGNAENFIPMAVVASADVDDIIIQPVQVEVKTIQETIENVISGEGLFTFQIEGNFTGSGNREIVAFYKYKERDSIIDAFCFVCDPTGEKVENAYYIEYGTLKFNERNDAETGLVESTNLGRAITYMDRIIGRAGDFNGNGREELYLYAKSGMNIEPCFFEFNGAEFEKIIELGSPDSAPIISIDPKEKVITLSINSHPDNREGVDWIARINSYTWNNTVQQYELLTSETKNYRWNRNLREYEEIE